MKTTFSTLALSSLLICIGCDNTTTQTPDPVLQNPAADSDVVTQVDETEVETEVTRQEVQAEAEQAIEAASQFAAQEQQKYRQQVYARLDQIQHHVEALEEEFNQVPVSATTSELQQTLKRLEQQISETRQQTQLEKGDTQEAWSQLKSTIDETVQELEASTERAREQLANEANVSDPVVASEENDPANE